MIDSNIGFVFMFNIWPTLTKWRWDSLKALHLNFHFDAISVEYIKVIWFINTIYLYQVIIFLAKRSHHADPTCYILIKFQIQWKLLLLYILPENFNQNIIFHTS